MAMTAVAAFMALSITSCEEKEEPTPGPVVAGNTVILAAEANSSATFTVEAESSWTINNPILWASFDVLSGTGNTDITVTATSTNEEMTERTGTFTVNDETYLLVQRGIKAVTVPKGTVALPGQYDELRIAVNSTFTKEEMSASTTTEWLTFTAIEATDSTLLDDGSTYSNLKTYELVFAATPNDGNEIKEGSVTLTCNGENYEISIRQYGPIDIDFSQEFYRHSLFMRFTSVHCGYCPLMDLGFENANTAMPERFVALSMYGYMSGSEDMVWSRTNELLSFYYPGSPAGFPYGVLNGIVGVPSMSPYSSIGTLLKNAAQEAVDELKAKTNIQAESRLSGNTVDIDVFIATKEALDYTISAYIVEDGVMHSQSDYLGLLPNPNNTEHNYVVRDLFAEDVPIEGTGDKGIGNVSLSCTIPGSVNNIDNAYVVIYTSYPGTFKGDVMYAQYLDKSIIIDNAVRIPLDGSVDFKYE